MNSKGSEGLSRETSVLTAATIVMAICHYDETNPVGGLEKQAGLLSRRMIAAGGNVVMLAGTRKWSRTGWHEKDGVRVRYFWTYASPQISGRYLPAALIWAAQLLLWVIWHRKHIAVFHCHQIRIHAFVGAIAHKLFGIPSLLKSATGGEGADIRSIGSRKYLGSLGRRFIIRHTDCFVATTGSVEEDLLLSGVPADRIAVIPNGLVLHQANKAAPSSYRATRALFLARLESDKHAVGLAHAALDIARSTGLTVDFYGEGSQRAALEAVVAQAGADAKVAYCGYVDDPMAVLGQYGYLLIASEAEGLSNSMLEGMANGVVPIATRVSGCVDHIVAGETGYYFDGLDHAHLVAGLQTIAATSTDAWQVMSRNVQHHARAHFDIDEVVRAYSRVYARLGHPMMATK